MMLADRLATFIYYSFVLLYFLLYPLSFLVMRLLRSQLKGKRDTKNFTIGIFHPYCNAGGGGERVLWCCVQSVQTRFPRARCVVYTGDEFSEPQEVLRKVKTTFNITVKPSIEFVRLKKRYLVEASRYPNFTMLGQSLGSMLLAWEAANALVPDVFFDTMGYAFSFPVFAHLCSPRPLIMCYVHYPTISTDMLGVVASAQSSYNNSAVVASSPIKRLLKLFYYCLFAKLYRLAGRHADVVLVNSSWTGGHINHIWAVPERTSRVFPPCDTYNLQKIPLNSGKRERLIVSIAQFRPEKNHKLQLESFALYLKRAKSPDVDLVLIGSCRNAADEKRVDDLRAICAQLGITSKVQFQINVSNEELRDWLSRASCGLHTMWCEHFGIGIVELMAAGVIPIANDSGGPQTDIVQPGETGFLASTAEQYASHIETVLDKLDASAFARIQAAGRESANRFSDEVFANALQGVLTQHVAPRVPSNKKSD